MPRSRPGTLAAVLLESAARSGVALPPEEPAPKLDVSDFLSRQGTFLQVRQHA